MSSDLTATAGGGGGGISQTDADLRYVKQDGSTPGASSQKQQFLAGVQLGDGATSSGPLDFATAAGNILRFKSTNTGTAGVTRPVNLSMGGNIGAGGMTLTIPVGTDTLATLGATQTLVNKTLTTPIENGVKVAVAAKTADYTLTATDYVVTVDATVGNVTLTLPAASASVGQVYRVKRLDASINTVTIAAAGADTIDGAASTTLVTQYSSKDIVGLTAATFGVF